MIKRISIILLAVISLCMAAVNAPMFAYTPFPTEGIGSWVHNSGGAYYSYAPATVFYEGIYHQFYCSNSQATDSHFNPQHLDNVYNSKDYIRYRTSKDGIHWSAPRVVMTVDKNHSENCACDPSVVYGQDGYWYLLYDGQQSGYGTVVYLARSYFIGGPYFTYTETGWQNENGMTGIPKALLKKELMPEEISAGRDYGVGQQTVAKVTGGDFYVWFRNTLNQFMVVHKKSLTEIKYKDAEEICFYENGTCRSFEYSGYEIGDVRWNVKGYWEMWCNYPYMQENTKIAKFMSGDGAHWTIENGDEIGSYNFIHNIGVSGDSLGWISNDQYLISFSGPHISDDAKVSLKANRNVLKKHNYSIDKQNSVNPLIGEWAMWQQHFGADIGSRTISYDKDGFTFPPVYKTSNVDYFTGDYDGDGVADLGVVNRDRNAWYVYSSLYRYPIYYAMPVVSQMNENFKIIAGDYDGDGITDIGAVDTVNGQWYIQSSKGARQGLGSSQLEPNWIPWGWSWGGMDATFKVIVGDYNGDGKADRAIYKSPNWYIISSLANDYTVANGFYDVRAAAFFPFGWSWSGMTKNHVAVPGDFDGDGITDRAIYGMNDGKWYLLSSRIGEAPLTWYWQSTNEKCVENQDYTCRWSWKKSQKMWGFRPFSSYKNTQPFAGDFDGDGVDDLVQVNLKTGEWFLYGSLNQGKKFPDGKDAVWDKLKNAEKPVILIGDFDGDGKADRAFADKATRKFYVISSKYKTEGIEETLDYAYRRNYFAKSAAEKPIEEPKAAPVVSKAPSMNVAVDGKKVTVTNVEYGSKVAVFDMLGKSVLEAPAGMNAATFEVPTYGKYIVRAGAQSRVIMVK